MVQLTLDANAFKEAFDKAKESNSKLGGDDTEDKSAEEKEEAKEETKEEA